MIYHFHHHGIIVCLVTAVLQTLPSLYQYHHTSLDLSYLIPKTKLPSTLTKVINYVIACHNCSCCNRMMMIMNVDDDDDDDDDDDSNDDDDE